MPKCFCTKARYPPLQEAFLAALSQPRQEDRIDDTLLEQGRSGALGGAASAEMRDLDADQLQSLRLERRVSKHNAAIGVVARAVRFPLFIPFNCECPDAFRMQAGQGLVC